ncbi:unnamed protein product [Spirodela intermedia]|uniref:protein-serine/threonine phosphatase n=1 Tax=Spirodela intermedia TaxID=51605 RepID=A0A7I8KIJ5_SPIIN|nr:unnamed protein product [Spirodela intermedia]
MAEDLPLLDTAPETETPNPAYPHAKDFVSNTLGRPSCPPLEGLTSETPIIAGDDPLMQVLPVNDPVDGPINEQAAQEIRAGGASKCCQLMSSRVPLWGHVSFCGRRPEMEDALAVVPHFSEIPAHMLTKTFSADGGLEAGLTQTTAHFFGIYDGHGGSQVANYCRHRMHMALMEEIKNLECASESIGEKDRQKLWESAFTNCFLKVDAEVGGTAHGSTGSGNDCCAEPVAPETVGSTSVVAVICSSHIIVANCGDSRAVLCRGKQPLPLSADHKPDREDEYARIEAAGGKVIQWRGYRVSGVLAMSRSIGDRYLKPWVIPDPEVNGVRRTKEDDCLILATDGLWDVMTNEEACTAARKRILAWHKKNGATATASTERYSGADPAAQAAAGYLARLAHQKGSEDNITVIVIDLRPHRRFKTRAVHAIE